MSEAGYIAPKVSVSYAWEDEAHRQWVSEFATRLRGDSVDVSLDRWMVGLGKPLPEFMEKLVRENERVLVICTPKYKEKSDGRIGGVGYEGDLMTGEMLTESKREKFIPVLRAGNWAVSVPSWLLGRSGVDLSGEEYSESEYRKLVEELHGRMPKAPPLGAPPVTNTSEDSRRARGVTRSTLQEPSEPVKIVGVIEEAVTSPRNDETRGSALYTVPFRLSRRPSSIWAKLFIENWNHPPRFTNRHRPGIARISGDKIILEGTTMEEVEQYHARTLNLAVQKTNEEAEKEVERGRSLAEKRRKSEQEHRDNLRDISKRLKFD